MKTVSNAIKVLIGAAVVGALLIALWSLPAPGTATKQSAVMVASSPAGMPDVHVRLWADQSVVSPGGSVKLRLRFENGTKDTLKSVSVEEVEEPGFTKVPLKLDKNTLKNGEATEAEVELQPSADHGSYRVAVRYQVTDANGMVHEGTIASSPITVRDEGAERKQLFYRRLTSLGKDLTLPLVLALLGFWFQKRQGVESQRQEIWKTILPHFYELSEKHYLPIVRSLRMVNGYRIKDWGVATQAQKDRLLFEFLFLLLRMRLLGQDKGQFFFKSRLGEMVVSDTWSTLALGSYYYLGRERVDAALEKIKVETTYKEFQYFLGVSQALQDIQAEFATWNTKRDVERFYRYTTFSVIMQEALYFEANRPFDRDWYGMPAEFDLKKMDTDEDSYPEPPVDAPRIETNIAKLTREVPAYKKEVRRYFRTLPKLKLPKA